VNNYRKDIQSARGIAVLGVLLFHAKLGFENGYLGVNIFFIISGYVTAPAVLRIVEQPAFNQFKIEFTRFLKLRFYRLFPAYFLVSVAGILGITLLSIPENVRNSAAVLMFSPVFLGNIAAYKFSNNYFFPQPSGFIHYWSLSVEEQIYILIPILLFTSMKVIKLKNFVLLAIPTISFVTWLILENSNFLSKFGISDPKGLNYYLVTTYVWQYFVGLFAFILENRIKKRLINSIQNYVYVMSVLVTISIIFLPLNSVLPLNHNLLWLMSSSAAFVFLVTGKRDIEQIGNRNRFVKRIQESIGNASYSIYLIHFPIFFLLFSSPIFVRYSENAFMKLVLILLIIKLGLISNKKIEKRFRKSSSRIFDLPGTKKSLVQYISLAMGIVLVCLICTGVGGHRWSLDTPRVGWTLDEKLFNPKARSNEIYVLDGNLRSIDRGMPLNSLFLAGDSHAGTMAKSLITKFPGNIDLLLKTGCPLVFSSYDFSCPGFGESVISQASTGKYQTIILTNRFNLIADNLSAFVDFYISLREASSARVIVVGPVPEILNTPRIGGTFWQSYGSAKIFHLGATSPTPIKVNNFLRQIFAPKDYVDAISELCSGRVCKLWSPKSGWIYNDRDHLSVAGANLLAKKILSILD